MWMGIDLGDARVGTAFSDPEEVLAFPAGDIDAHGDSFCTLDEVAHSALLRGVSCVVIGLPLSLSGGKGKAAQKAKRWGKQLAVRFQRSGREPAILFQDERLTTVTAHQQLLEAGLSMKKHRSRVDRQAAVIILQQALDRKNGKDAKRKERKIVQ